MAPIQTTAQNMPRHKPLEGVAWMVGSGLAFVGVNAIVRALGTDLPAAQSAFIRYGFGVLFFLPMLPSLWRQGLPSGAVPVLAWRGVVHTAAVVFWFVAMARIPLAHVTAIGYLSPVILLIAGAVILNEGLTRRRMLAVGLAVIGTLIVLRPGLEPVSIGHLGQIAAASCFAASYLFAKKLSAFVPASVVVAMLTFTVTLGLLPLALWDWRPVSGLQAVLFGHGHQHWQALLPGRPASLPPALLLGCPSTLYRAAIGVAVDAGYTKVGGWDGLLCCVVRPSPALVI